MENLSTPKSFLKHFKVSWLKLYHGRCDVYKNWANTFLDSKHRSSVVHKFPKILWKVPHSPSPLPFASCLSLSHAAAAVTVYRRSYFIRLSFLSLSSLNNFCLSLSLFTSELKNWMSCISQVNVAKILWKISRNFDIRNNKKWIIWTLNDRHTA